MNHVNITVPVVFVAEVKKTNRHRNFEAIRVFKNVDVKIMTLEEGEMQLAARYYKWGAPNDNVDVGYYDNRFFERYYFNDVKFNGTEKSETIRYLDLDLMIEKTAKANSHGNPLLISLSSLFLGDFLRGELLEFMEDDYADFNKVSVERQLNYAIENAEKLVIVGNAVWREVYEPHYEISSPGISSNDPPTFAVVNEDREKLAPEFKFSLNDWEAMSEQSARVFGRELARDGLAEVFMPEVFTMDKTLDIVLNQLTRAVDSQARRIPEADIDTMIAWARFRDAVWQAKRVRDEDSIDTAILLAQRYKASPNADRYADSFILEAHKRWSGRPIALTSSLQRDV